MKGVPRRLLAFATAVAGLTAGCGMPPLLPAQAPVRQPSRLSLPVGAGAQRPLFLLNLQGKPGVYYAERPSGQGPGIYLPLSKSWLAAPANGIWGLSDGNAAYMITLYQGRLAVAGLGKTTVPPLPLSSADGEGLGGAVLWHGRPVLIANRGSGNGRLTSTLCQDVGQSWQCRVLPETATSLTDWRGKPVAVPLGGGRIFEPLLAGKSGPNTPPLWRAEAAGGNRTLYLMTANGLWQTQGGSFRKTAASGQNRNFLAIAKVPGGAYLLAASPQGGTGTLFYQPDGAGAGKSMPVQVSQLGAGHPLLMTIGNRLYALLGDRLAVTSRNRGPVRR